MLGYTLANLDNEPRFFQHNFSHCRAGDFLILDIQQRPSPASASEAETFRMVTSPHRPSDIRESDRLFQDKLVWI